MSVKVSIIIPVYNVESYLKECLESCLNQTLPDIEIICVNDGSTDNSLKILNEYADKDNRIKVFSQKNSGPAVARNFGILKATGEYILFVDSDDRVNLEICEKLYNKAINTSSDIVLSTFYNVANNQQSIDTRINIVKNNIKDEVCKFEDEISGIIPFVPYETHCKLYKTSFLKENNVSFPVSIRLAEDCCFFIHCCLYNPAISVVDEALYYYRINSNNSLVKRPDTVKHLYAVFKKVKKLIDKSKIKNKDELYYCFITRLILATLAYWKSCYTLSNQKSNFKYLKNLKKYYTKLPNKHPETYFKLKDAIFNFQFLYIRKLFEPVIEIENRLTRFVIYIFSKQVLNISKIPFRSLYYNFFYFFMLLKLRIVKNFRQIKVGFWVTESQKWTQQQFFEKLKNDKHFEPFILLSYFRKPQGSISPKEHYNSVKKLFEELNNKVYDTFDENNCTFKKLSEFKPDIIFYQQPWQIPEEQMLEKNHKNSILCYIPYCFYSMNSYVNYLSKFHGVMWKYFVESDYHKAEYKKIFGATNCLPVGSVKLDNYHNINLKNAENYWKSKDKKRIIYAPHHSFNDGIHEVATFKENGEFILKLAKSHPETEWIFRPHPAFIDRILKNSIMSREEIKKYYEEWEKNGQISTGGNYYEMFLSSDCLITDCISFLSEYAPTLKPVLHLRKSGQKDEFNALVAEIDKSYYQIYDNAELEKVFNDVIVNGNDTLKEARENNKKILLTDDLASENIFNYIKKELRIK